jgi:excisionase family DNA binding protein
MNEINTLLTTRQLQDLLQVDRITIYRMLSDGRLRGFKVGGQWRFPRREIERWLQEQRFSLEAAEAPASREDALVPSVEALPLSCIQAMQDIYAEALDIAAITLDRDGSPLTEISNSCGFCDLILSTDEGRRRCASDWKAVNKDGFHTCHAGLTCVSAPITVGGQWVATTASCQFVARVPDRQGEAWAPDLPLLAARLGLAESNLQARAGSVRQLPDEARRRIPHLLQRLVETFSEIGQQRLHLLNRLHRIAEISHM